MYTYTHTHIHTRTHTYIHTYIHIHSSICIYTQYIFAVTHILYDIHLRTCQENKYNEGFSDIQHDLEN